MKALRLTLCLALGLLAGSAGAAGGNYAQRAEVRQFIAEMVEKHGFVKRELVRLFRDTRFQPAILRAMSVPPESPARSWQAYRDLFVSPARIEAGVRFRGMHAATLDRASAEFGVPAEIIVAIIGVETAYGRNMGAWRVIDALATLAFDFPRRAEYFRGELEHFLLHARDEGIDILATRGSYAGAIGMPQFMPGSYRSFALDYDGDGRRDIEGSAADAIGSVANFLKAHGWAAGQPVAVPASVEGGSHRRLIDSGIRPQVRAADLASFGVSALAALPPEALCALIELDSAGQDSQFRIGLQNFYVLTRYNRSSFYAAAVLDLAQALSEAKNPAATGTDAR